MAAQVSIWDFPKIRVPYFDVLIIRILLFRVLSPFEFDTHTKSLKPWSSDYSAFENPTKASDMAPQGAQATLVAEKAHEPQEFKLHSNMIRKLLQLSRIKGLTQTAQRLSTL